MYFWDMSQDAWMHKPNDVGVGVSITFSKSATAYQNGPSAVNIAGYDGTYQELPIGPDGIRTQVWIVDMGGTRVTITLEAQPSTTAAELAEAQAIIESIHREPAPTGGSWRLTFALPAGWDSG